MAKHDNYFSTNNVTIQATAGPKISCRTYLVCYLCQASEFFQARISCSVQNCKGHRRWITLLTCLLTWNVGSHESGKGKKEWVWDQLWFVIPYVLVNAGKFRNWNNSNFGWNSFLKSKLEEVWIYTKEGSDDVPLAVKSAITLWYWHGSTPLSAESFEGSEFKSVMHEHLPAQPGCFNWIEQQKEYEVWWNAMLIRPNLVSKSTWSVMSRKGSDSLISKTNCDPTSGRVASHILPCWLDAKARLEPSGCGIRLR